MGEYIYTVRPDDGAALMEGYRHPGADELEVDAIVLIDQQRWRVRDPQFDVDQMNNDTLVVEPLKSDELERTLESVRDVEDG